MKICVVGAGNIGLVLASVVSARKKADVVIFSNTPFDAESIILDDREANSRYQGLGIKATSNPIDAFSGAEYVFCTYPAFLRKQFIDEYGFAIESKSKLGFVPGYGGIEYSCASLLKRGVVVFGFQRVPFVARQESKRIASLISRKQTLFLASIPKDNLKKICVDIEHLLGIPTKALNQYLAVTLVPSNPLLHLTGLYNVFKNYHKGDVFDHQLMFYEEWNDEASQMLLDYDNELQRICKAMPIDLSEIVPLTTYYESETPEKMTKKLKSIKAFEVVKVPLIKSEKGYVPDFSSRMFVEDYPFGIALIKDFAIKTGVKTPVVDKLLDFYSQMTGIVYFSGNKPGKDLVKTGVPSNAGLNTLAEIVEFYEK